MKAVVYDKSNAPDVLVLREVEKPTPNDKEVLVKIHAVSINAADYRSMKMGIIPKRKIFGADIAGRIEVVGKVIGALSQVIKSMLFGAFMSIGSRKIRVLVAKLSPLLTSVIRFMKPLKLCGISPKFMLTGKLSSMW